MPPIPSVSVGRTDQRTPANNAFFLVSQASEEKPVTSNAVFSMFGGGAKKEKKEDEDRGDNSGSAKAQREAAAAAKEDVSLSCSYHDTSHREVCYRSVADDNVLGHRMKFPSLRMSISSRLCT